jgi:uncharacterized protein (TIGR02145 family)
MYAAEYGSYPTSIDSNKCPKDSSNNVDTNYCLKASSSNTLVYSASSTGTSFRLSETNTNSTTYSVTDSQSPVATIASTDTNWLTIGSQLWSKTNLNVGTRIAGTTDQTNNSGTNIVEKYCSGNLESNCTAYGGLYQWDEAMQYTNTEGAQGICPTGSHIPSDNDWKILEIQLGMTQAQADLDSTWARGTDQGTKLKSGGTSGLNMPITGYRMTGGSFFDLSLYAYLWSSSRSTSTTAWIRVLDSGSGTVNRGADGINNGYGFSVRCIGN